MTVSREQVFLALFGLTQGVQWNVGTELDPVMVGFATRTRRIKLFSDVSTAEQPWLGQAEHDEDVEQKSNLPYKRTWKAEWMIYHQAGNTPDYEPTIWNNLIIDQLEKAIAPKPTDPGFLDERNTLSGLVYHCFISGKIFKDPGDIDNQALIIVPIVMLIP